MTNYKKLLPAAALLGSVAACHGDFLTGGELSNDPNNPVTASSPNLFTAIQANLWYTLNGEMSRVTGIFAQSFNGELQNYATTDIYQISEQTTNSAQQAFYLGGGLVDVRTVENNSLAEGDSIFAGIAQVQEGWLMGSAADLFGNLVYNDALKGTANPPLDPQLEVYDSVQALLSRAIVNLQKTGGKNAGPGPVDLSYGGDPALWTQLAHTLKARFYMHTAEVRGNAAYTAALAQARLGISTPDNDYKTNYSGGTGEQNPLYQLNVVAGRAGYLVPGSFLDSLMTARNDPRRTDYFAVDTTIDNSGTVPDTTVNVDFSAARQSATYNQGLATYTETQLIIAEAAYRTGDISAAQTALVAERTAAGFAPNVADYGGAPPTGQALLREILYEKYISDFMVGFEAWMDYKRTCSPNLPPRIAGGKIPGRLFYDAGERQTDTNIPDAGVGINGLRPQADPVNATSDATGAACLAGA